MQRLMFGLGRAKAGVQHPWFGLLLSSPIASAAMTSAQFGHPKRIRLRRVTR